MDKRLWLWLVPGVLYAGFWFWYSNTEGPLTEEEIAAFTEMMQEGGRDALGMANMRRFMEEDTGHQFLMVNIIDMADKPRPVEGAGPEETSGQVMNRYMEHMYPELFKRASHPAFMGNAVFTSMDIVGIEGAEQWTAAVLMRYRSRRDLLEIALNPAFSGRHDFKMAALDKTIAYPVEAQLYLGDPRLLLFLVLLAAISLLHIVLSRSRSG